MGEFLPFEQEQTEPGDEGFYRALWQSVMGEYHYTLCADDLSREGEMEKQLRNIDFLTHEERQRCMADYRLHLYQGLNQMGTYDE